MVKKNFTDEEAYQKKKKKSYSLTYCSEILTMGSYGALETGDFAVMIIVT